LRFSQFDDRQMQFCWHTVPELGTSSCKTSVKYYFSKIAPNKAQQRQIKYRSTWIKPTESANMQTKQLLKARCTNVVHDLGSAEPRSKVEPSSCWITLHQDELESAATVQLNGRGYTVDDADWSTMLGLRANYNDVTVTRNAYKTVQYRLTVICSNFMFPWSYYTIFTSTVALIKFRRYTFCVPIDIC